MDTDLIKQIQTKLGLTADGVLGPKTCSAIASALGVKAVLPLAPVIPSSSQPSLLDPAAVKLIIDSEGMDQAWKWPGGASGVTIGRGYDLGYTPVSEFHAEWQDYLEADQLAALAAVCGLKGGAAESASHGLRSIKVSEAAADAVFAKFTVPVWIKTTAECFPGSDKLPAKCFGALVSLVYNRGPSVEGSSRREMLEIKKLIQAGAPQSVPTSIRSMKRLWIGKDEDGLLVRRDAEAALFEEGLKTVQTAAEA